MGPKSGVWGPAPTPSPQRAAGCGAEPREEKNGRFTPPNRRTLAPFATSHLDNISNSTAPHKHTAQATERARHTQSTRHRDTQTVTERVEKPSGQYSLRGCDEGGNWQKEGGEGAATTPNPNPNSNRGRGLSLARLESWAAAKPLLRCPATCRSGPVEN